MSTKKGMVTLFSSFYARDHSPTVVRHPTFPVGPSVCERRYYSCRLSFFFFRIWVDSRQLGGHRYIAPHLLLRDLSVGAV